MGTDYLPVLMMQISVVVDAKVMVCALWCRVVSCRVERLTGARWVRRAAQWHQHEGSIALVHLFVALAVALVAGAAWPTLTWTETNNKKVIFGIAVVSGVDGQWKTFRMNINKIFLWHYMNVHNYVDLKSKDEGKIKIIFYSTYTIFIVLQFSHKTF